MMLGLGVIVVLVTMLASLAPILATALGQASLERRVAEASPTERSVIASGRIDPGQFDGIDARFGSEMAAIPEMGDPWSLLLSDAFGAEIDRVSGRRVVTALASWSGSESALGPVSGVLPSVAGQAAVHVAAADALGLALGDTFIVDRAGQVVELELVGLVDPPAALNEISLQMAEGVLASGSFLSVGPVLVPADQLLNVAERVTATWVAEPVVDEIDEDRIGGWTSQLAGLDAALSPLTVESGLPALLAGAQRSLRSAAATVGAVLTAVTVLSLVGLAVAVTAATERRRLPIELVSSRGSSRLGSTVNAALEGSVLAVIGLVAGPLLAVALIRLAGSTPILGALGAALDPRVSVASLVPVAIAAIGSVAVLAAPALSGAGGYAAAQAIRSRPSSIGLLRRWGIDLIVLAAGLIGVWRLRATWSPVEGVDPLIVVAPVLVWMAGVVLLARLLPPLLRRIEGWSTTAPVDFGLAVSWAARQPDRSNRQAVLTASAVAMLTFVSTYGATWWQSQTDQAQLEVGWVASGPAGVEATGTRSPLITKTVSLGSTLQGVALVALDTGVVPIRSDLVSPADSWEGLGSGETIGVTLGGDEVEGEVTVRASGTHPISGQVRLALIVRDGSGLVTTTESRDVEVGATTPFRIPVAGSEPRSLVGWRIAMPGSGPAPGSDSASALTAVILDSLSSGGQPLALGAGEWSSAVSASGAVGAQASIESISSSSVESEILFVPQGIQSGVVVEAAISPPELPELAALFTPSLLQESGLAVGDTIQMSVGAINPQVRVVGTIEALPTAPDRAKGLVVDAADLAALSWIEGKEFGDPDRFLWGSPIEGEGVIVSAERREQRLSDPIAVGVIGSLGFGGLATTVIVMIATWFGVSTAVSTRSFELALLRALGITRARLAAMVGRENLLVAALGTGAGLVIGLGLALTTLDTLVRDADGVPVVPSPLLVIPWQGLLGAVIVGLGGMAAAVSFARRSIDAESPGATIRAGEER